MKNKNDQLCHKNSTRDKYYYNYPSQYTFVNCLEADYQTYATSCKFYFFLYYDIDYTIYILLILTLSNVIIYKNFHFLYLTTRCSAT